MLAALKIQCHVVGALMMREVHTRYGRDNIGFLWLCGEPLMFALGVETMWSVFNKQDHNLPIVPFLLCGYLPLVMWRNVNGRALTCVQSNRGLLFHRQVKLLDLFLARFILEIAGVLLAFAFSYLLFYGVGLMNRPMDIWSMYCGWFLMIWFSVSTGLLLGALGQFSELVDRIWHPLSYLMLPITGAFFMVQWIPYKYQSWALCMPMWNATELIRRGYFGDAVRTSADITYVCYFCAIEMFIALLLLSYARRRVTFA